MVAALFTGIAQGLNQWDKEAKQIRLDNMRAFNEQVRMAAELGMAPDPAELSKMAEGITGGSNWQMAALPGEELRRGISERLAGIKQAREAQSELTVLQTREANDRFFNSLTSDYMLSGGKIEDFAAHLQKKFEKNPNTLRAANEWIGNKDLNTVRSNIFSAKVTELSQNIVAGDTPDSVRQRFAGMPAEVVEKLATVARARQAEASRRELPTLLNSVTAQANAGVFLKPGPDGKSVFNEEAAAGYMKALNIPPQIQMSLMPSIRRQSEVQGFSYDRRKEDDALTRSDGYIRAYGNAKSVIQNDAGIVSRIVEGGAGFNTGALRDHLRATVPGSDQYWTDDMLNRLVEDVRLVDFQSRVDKHRDREAAAAAAGLKQYDEAGGPGRKNAEDVKDAVSKSGSKDQHTQNIMETVSRHLYVDNIGKASAIAAEIIKQESSNKTQSGAIAEKISRKLLEEGVARLKEEHKREWVSEFVRVSAGVKPQRFDEYYNGPSGIGGQRSAIANEFERDPGLRISRAADLEQWNQRRSIALRRVDVALSQLTAETSDPRLLYGYDQSKVNQMRNELLEYRRSIVEMERPNLPADRAERVRIDAAANRSAGDAPRAPAAVDELDVSAMFPGSTPPPQIPRQQTPPQPPRPQAPAAPEIPRGSGAEDRAAARMLEESRATAREMALYRYLVESGANPREAAQDILAARQSPGGSPSPGSRREDVSQAYLDLARAEMGAMVSRGMMPEDAMREVLRRFPELRNRPDGRGPFDDR